MQFTTQRGLAIALLLTFSVGVSAGQTPPTTTPATQRTETHEPLARALAETGWLSFPKPIIDVQHSGPTPTALDTLGSPPENAWFITRRIDGNSRPRVDPRQEEAFVRSVKAAHAGRTRLVDGGIVLLVDPAGRMWTVAEHMPHLLRCYDGKRWTYKRADGLPAGDDEPAAFARLAKEGKLLRPQYAKDGLRDLNDLGRWYAPACADGAGHLHFFAACVSADAAQRGAGGGGVHTLGPDGSWSFFRIFPAEMPRSAMPFDDLRCILHARDGAADEDLVTVAEFRLSDPVAEAHGHKVELIPQPNHRLRQQQWKPRTQEPRHGPSFYLRFDGKAWRVDRSSVGWGVYDAVHRSWPQPDGRIYISNRFGLWLQWPPKLPAERVDRMIADLVEAGDRDVLGATGALASLGRRGVPALTAAFEQASTDRSRRRLLAARQQAERVAQGEEEAVPVVGGRWRFFGAYPQATMRDGRFAFHCDRAVDAQTGQEINDCLVFFDPATEIFEIRVIDRVQWSTTDFYDRRANEPPVKNLDGTVIDLAGGLWVPGGYRCDKDGRIRRLVPPGVKLRLPHFVDANGRIYFMGDAPNQVTLHAYREAAEPAPAATRAAPTTATTQPTAEQAIENVRGLFRQPELAPPWNAWAVQERSGRTDLLLRLDGAEPTQVELPSRIDHVSAVIPLQGGCIAVGREAAAFRDGEKWHVARDVKALIELHAQRLVRMAPPRAFAADTSGERRHVSFGRRLLLASDGRGGLWFANNGVDTRQTRQMWHWRDGTFTDLWALMPLEPEVPGDGAVMTADRGRALVVQLDPTGVRPGGYWAIWRVTKGELREDNRHVPQLANSPGLHPVLLAARGPNTTFSSGLWADREGWIWSTILSETGQHWVRRLDGRVGHTPLGRTVWGQSFAQGTDGHGGDGRIWFVAGKMGDPPAVWADVSPRGEEPRFYARNDWVGKRIDGMGASAQVAVAPDGNAYLLHEAGISLLRVQKREKPATSAPVRPATRPATTRFSATRPRRITTRYIPPRRPDPNWEIIEAARGAWDHPKNDFGARVAFDETGAWFLPQEGPLIRVPLPRE